MLPGSHATHRVPSVFAHASDPRHTPPSWTSPSGHATHSLLCTSCMRRRTSCRCTGCRRSRRRGSVLHHTQQRRCASRLPRPPLQHTSRRSGALSRHRCHTTHRPGTPHTPPGTRRTTRAVQSARRRTSRRGWREQPSRLWGAPPRTSRRTGARRPRTGGASPCRRTAVRCCTTGTRRAR